MGGRERQGGREGEGGARYLKSSRIGWFGTCRTGPVGNSDGSGLKSSTRIEGEREEKRGREREEEERERGGCCGGQWWPAAAVGELRKPLGSVRLIRLLNEREREGGVTHQREDGTVEGLSEASPRPSWPPWPTGSENRADGVVAAKQGLSPLFVHRPFFENGDEQ